MSNNNTPMGNEEDVIKQRLDQMEKRQDHFEEVVAGMAKDIADIKTSVALLTAAGSKVLIPGETLLCKAHQAELAEIRKQIEKNSDCIETLKARVWYFSGAAAAIGYFADKLFSK